MPYNYFLTQVMQRYSVNPLKAGGYFYAQLHLKGLDKEFIFSILNLFEENNFKAAAFEPFSIELIVDYIQRTHAFYLQKKLPEIEQSILLLHNYYQSNHPLLKTLHDFFQRYCNELGNHLREEENKLLPYIVMLRNAENSPKHLLHYLLAGEEYSITKFLAGHHDTEDELMQIRNAIRMYNPPVSDQSLHRILLSQLQAFEQDLHVHAIIEEQVLIPKAIKIETELKYKLRYLVLLN
ncbi:hemerythrin domain-containing protein [Solitalea lacus]|uniref:hemerythrin domain-containing protein n=1 Tax=Solitalea lacus TaxID=2911172 RepID=UPI001EDA9BB3|nr:hemerythrin domain-containing protein [Solitalea lacus]UKJ06727.1 hemerythrin domain-containing protein [Solitalea lacus]